MNYQVSIISEYQQDTTNKIKGIKFLTPFEKWLMLQLIKSRDSARATQREYDDYYTASSEWRNN